MADYREISHEYAKGAINAATLMNAGAAVAVLSQLSEIYKLGLLDSVVYSVMIWGGGVVLASLAWPTAFLSARYVDKSERETALTSRHLKTSDRLMALGICLVIASVACFAFGSAYMAGWYSAMADMHVVPKPPS